jgi:hypothetical protein
MSTNADNWIEMQLYGAHTVRIELTRCGHLWHGQAAKLVGRNVVERNPLATAIGGDFEAVRHEVIRTAQKALKH